MEWNGARCTSATTVLPFCSTTETPDMAERGNERSGHWTEKAEGRRGGERRGGHYK